ncbi:MAG: ATP-binding protein [Planctomycetaceae bacterium]|jgi:SpoVK/Ycf46/Vps4 family AAA+-type ATPase|nr:ATP-binding protein [Planctomycetaceae bacterium]
MNTDKKEKNIVLYYLNNLVKQNLPQKKEEELLQWVEEHSKDLFSIDLANKWGTHTYRTRGRVRHYSSNSDDEAPELEHNIQTIRHLLLGKKIIPVHACGFDKKIDLLFDVFDVKTDYQEILRYIIFVVTIPMLGDLHENLVFKRHDYKNRGRDYAAISGVSRHVAEKNFAFNSPLVTNGILNCPNKSRGSFEYSEYFEFSESFQKLLHSKFRTEKDIKRLILGSTGQATLQPENFSYIAEDFNYIKTILQTAVRKRKTGVNVLLYGEPGTGKTEMCKTLAAEIGSNLYMISENSDGNKNSRIFELALAQTILRNDSNAVILIDEAEDIFYQNPFARHEHSKLYFNRMLEKNTTPVIWVSNNIGRMDRAYLRRFIYALEMPKPDCVVTQNIWKNVLTKHKVRLSDEKIAEYSEHYDVAPSFIETAVKVAKFVKNPAVIERTIDSLDKASKGFVTRKNLNKIIPFEPSLLNTDINLEELAERIVKKGIFNISLCLYGVPGTGKSAYARYLADQMKLKVLQKRASDLQSMWVGETEKNIARAFNEAYQKKSLLIFDEADSFLSSRENAIRNWEVSQVNEMLTWMENHPYPVVFTTNLMDNLDEASLRRFKFKVKYHFLTPTQVKQAFKHFFNIAANGLTEHLTALTPGDFVVVKDKIDLMDVTDYNEIVKMLDAEQAVKKWKPRPRIGFC